MPVPTDSFRSCHRVKRYVTFCFQLIGQGQIKGSARNLAKRAALDPAAEPKLQRLYPALIGVDAFAWLVNVRKPNSDTEVMSTDGDCDWNAWSPHKIKRAHANTASKATANGTASNIQPSICMPGSTRSSSAPISVAADAAHSEAGKVSG